MMDQSPDDIFALFSRFDLDAEHYRVFRKPEPAAAPEPQAALAQIPPPAVSEPPVEQPMPEHVDSRDNTSGVALRNLLRKVSPVRAMPTPVSAAAFAAACISVRGAAGGTGSTTIAATLARLFGKSRRRCAIFDGTQDLTLPIYFGHQRIGSDQLRFAGLQSLFQPSVRILGPEHLIESSSEPHGALIESRLRHLAGEYDHLILDHPARFSEPTGAGVTILTAVPDVNSLAGASKLNDHFETSGQTAKTVCVLNRFDHGMTLHREIFGWYKDHFEHVVTISPSHLVPEALAEGTTVIDWAPQTSVCNEFMHLFKLVTHLLGKSPLMETHRSDDMTFDAERVPLCS
jgi:cellulose biosynthesis protein BcsQ